MFKDMNALLKQAKQMQAKLEAMQAELEKRTFTGQAGGGTVRVTLNGKHELVEIHIDPQAAGDAEVLEDLIAVAHRAAHAELQATLQREMGGLGGAGGLLPGL